jgi:hypothetical protein
LSLAANDLLVPHPGIVELKMECTVNGKTRRKVE